MLTRSGFLASVTKPPDALHYGPMPPWNAWTHLQAVQFDREHGPKMRPVRQCSAPLAAGELVRVGMSGVEVEAVVVSNAPGLLTVKVKRTPAKVTAPDAERKRKRRS
jgi:hypothetical protein